MSRSTSYNLSSLSAEEEEISIQKAQNGDSEAFSILYRAYVKPIYYFCYGKVGNREEAEDLTSLVFTKMLESLKNFSFRSSFKTWLYKIATFTVADYFRKRYQMKLVSLEEFIPEGNDDLHYENEENNFLKEEENNERVKKIFDALPENYQKVLECRFLKNCTLLETAQELGFNVNHVKVLQHRALKKAAELFDEDV